LSGLRERICVIHFCRRPLLKAAVPKAVWIAVLFLTSCSHQPVTSEQLSSNLKAGISLASEAEALIDFVSQGRATNAYARGHAAYLWTEADRTAKELHEGNADQATAKKLEVGRRLLDSLARELTNVSSDIS